MPPERISAELAERNLRVTHLINNARSLDALAVGADGTTASEAFLDELEIDVVQPYRLTMVLAEHPAHALRAVVNIGSQYGEVAMNPALYERCCSAYADSIRRRQGSSSPSDTRTGQSPCT